MMTKEELRLVVVAWCDGKQIQFRGQGEWLDYRSDSIPNFRNTDLEWRVKPEMKLRPWKPEEVPVGAVFKDKDDYRESLIIGRDIGCGMKIAMTTHGCEPILVDMLVSAINPKIHIWRWPQETQWHPCGVEE